MKKILFIALALMMVATFVGCTTSTAAEQTTTQALRQLQLSKQQLQQGQPLRLEKCLK